MFTLKLKYLKLSYLGEYLILFCVCKYTYLKAYSLDPKGGFLAFLFLFLFFFWFFCLISFCALYTKEAYRIHFFVSKIASESQNC